ncbi:4Fe-4S binding protein [Kitasatospora viridis]|uniref:4Fe-4S binding protein n=1 Tax=Kitasatospora viridis TaxID=281105 RepID=A0A561SDP6_9ACTN|nr:4Fe-4S binding protein [Kitasatospora viridis]TWF72955.1 4Fe-4S binding protein [Kitasatospora viridis]
MPLLPVVFQVNWNACIQCGACVAVCPKEAGFTTPFDTIATDTPCDIACMACEKVCPVTAIDSRTATEQEQAELAAQPVALA